MRRPSESKTMNDLIVCRTLVKNQEEQESSSLHGAFGEEPPLIDMNSTLIQSNERVVAPEVSPRNRISSRAVEEEAITSSLTQKKNDNNDDLLRFIEEKKQDFATLNHGKD